MPPNACELRRQVLVKGRWFVKRLLVYWLEGHPVAVKDAARNYPRTLSVPRVPLNRTFQYLQIGSNFAPHQPSETFSPHTVP